MTRTPPKKQAGTQTGPRTFSGAVLDVRTAAAFVGCSEKALRAHVSRQTVPFRRLGGRVLFLRSEIESWLLGLDGCTLDTAKENMAARRM